MTFDWDLFCISVGFLGETNGISNLYYQNDVIHAYINQSNTLGGHNHDIRTTTQTLYNQLIQSAKG
ncbi:TPA: hypothetical protein I2036_000087 [Staphylococcus aureus]|nr:hypothetical protein [Staphylococcus aureus]